MVKPVMKRSSRRLKANAMGTATRIAAACSDCQKKTSPRISSVGTPMLIVFASVGEMNASA
jgi:hypothetical protein